MEKTYGSLREKIAADKAMRIERDKHFTDIVLEAGEAGVAAAYAAHVTKMVVVERANPFNHNSPVVNRWEVPDGPCGFAWIVIKDGRSSFGRWLVKQNLARKHYPKGLCIWVHHYNQSMQRKEAHAQAYAAVLRKHGIEAHAASRMD